MDVVRLRTLNLGQRLALGVLLLEIKPEDPTHSGSDWACRVRQEPGMWSDEQIEEWYADDSEPESGVRAYVCLNGAAPVGVLVTTGDLNSRALKICLASKAFDISVQVQIADLMTLGALDAALAQGCTCITGRFDAVGAAADYARRAGMTTIRVKPNGVADWVGDASTMRERIASG